MANQKKKYLNKHLRFKNPAYEKEYSEMKSMDQYLVLKLFSAYSILVSFVTLIINADESLRSNPLILGFRVGLLVLTLSIFMIAKWKPQYVEYFLIIQFFYTFVTLAETFKKNMEFGWKVPFFALGMYLEILCLALIVSKIGWVKNIAFIIMINIFSATRYLKIGQVYSEEFILIFHLTINTLVLAILAFCFEKRARSKYYVTKKHEFTLICFSELIKDVFPSPVIISNGNKLLFFNQETVRRFNCDSEAELLECFKSFTIDTQFEGLSLERDIIDKIEGSNGELKKRTEFDSLCLLNNDLEGLSFFELLKKSTEFLSKRHSFLISFRGAYGSCESKIYFDIKLKNIVWEKKYAMMIILTENKTVQTIKALKEQAVYKDNLLATVSHDLRTPLNGIIGMISESINCIKEAEIIKNLNVSLRSAKSLLFMINDILDYHQISNGKLRLNSEYFSLWELIHDVSKLIKFQAKLKGLNFIRDNRLPSSESQAFIRSDPNRLRQIILNLLGNALKFTTVGAITIRLEKLENNEPEFNELRTPERTNSYKRGDYIVRVNDTGIGINKEDQKKLFQLFGKIESSAREYNKGGVGLGLAISQDLVRILNKNRENYEIKVISEIGVGSCFYFPISSFEEEGKSEAYIESDLCEPNAQILKSKIEGNAIKVHGSGNFDSRSKKLNLLIVEDDQINIVVISAYLKSLDWCKYDIANNGLHALEKIKAKAEKHAYYDLVFMDCNMPIMNGFEATKLIRELVNSSIIPEVKVIACTANATPSDYEECFKVGMNDYITKPFSKKEMLDKINKHLTI